MSETETTVPMDDKALFDAAMAPDTPAEPQAAPEAAATEQAEPPGEQPRDEHGRFAPKAEVEQPQEQPPEQPAKTEAPPAQGEAVPQWRLMEVVEARRQAESRAQQLETQLHQLSARLNQLTQQPKESKDLFVDPDGFVRDKVEPIQQQFEAAIARLREDNSKLLATEKFGDEVVTAAFNEMDRAMKTGTGRYDYARIMQSPHPYGELVKWHKQQQARQTVGDDPEGWLKTTLAERGKDPAKRAELLAMLGGQPAQSGAAPQQQSIVRMPPSLNRQSGVTANGNAGTMDDRSLYDFATR